MTEPQRREDDWVKRIERAREARAIGQRMREGKPKSFLQPIVGRWTR